MDKAYYTLVNEGGEGYGSELSGAEIDAAMRAKHNAFVAKQEAELATWTLDVTKARRAAWNAQVTKNPNAVVAQRVLGFNITNLKAAVKHHGL